MRAGWWWIDRWRKSTAYTDMTAEQQGVYRNLLDELWLRDGLLPLSEKALAQISGDFAAWPRVREVVLARFEKGPDGYRHRTHDEVAAQSKSFRDAQADAGRARAARARRDESGRLQPATPAGKSSRLDQPASPAGYQPNDQPPSPSPSPSPSQNSDSDSTQSAREARAPVRVRDGTDSKPRRHLPFDWGPVLAEFPALDTPEVRTACEGFCDARRSKHGAWTPQGMRIAVRRFVELGPDALRLAFEQATEAPWKTIYVPDALEHRNGHGPRRNGQHLTETQLERRKREGMEQMAVWQKNLAEAQ